MMLAARRTGTRNTVAASAAVNRKRGGQQQQTLRFRGILLPARTELREVGALMQKSGVARPQDACFDFAPETPERCERARLAASLRGVKLLCEHGRGPVGAAVVGRVVEASVEGPGDPRQHGEGTVCVVGEVQCDTEAGRAVAAMLRDGTLRELSLAHRVVPNGNGNAAKVPVEVSLVVKGARSAPSSVCLVEASAATTITTINDNSAGTSCVYNISDSKVAIVSGTIVEAGAEHEQHQHAQSHQQQQQQGQGLIIGMDTTTATGTEAGGGGGIAAELGSIAGNGGGGGTAMEVDSAPGTVNNTNSQQQQKQTKGGGGGGGGDTDKTTAAAATDAQKDGNGGEDAVAGKAKAAITATGGDQHKNGDAAAAADDDDDSGITKQLTQAAQAVEALQAQLDAERKRTADASQQREATVAELKTQQAQVAEYQQREAKYKHEAQLKAQQRLASLIQNLPEEVQGPLSQISELPGAATGTVNASAGGGNPASISGGVGVETTTMQNHLAAEAVGVHIQQSMATSAEKDKEIQRLHGLLKMAASNNGATQVLTPGMLGGNQHQQLSGNNTTTTATKRGRGDQDEGSLKQQVAAEVAVREHGDSVTWTERIGAGAGRSVMTRSGEQTVCASAGYDRVVAPSGLSDLNRAVLNGEVTFHQWQHHVAPARNARLHAEYGVDNEAGGGLTVNASAEHGGGGGGAGAGGGGPSSSMYSYLHQPKGGSSTVGTVLQGCGPSMADLNPALYKDIVNLVPDVKTCQRALEARMHEELVTMQNAQNAHFNSGMPPGMRPPGMAPPRTPWG